MSIKLPESTYNWISFIGMAIASIAFFMIVFLFVISSVTGSDASYLGLIIYIILPSILILGLILIPIGMFFRSKKLKRQKSSEPRKLPVIDLNNVRFRNATMIFAIGTTILLFMSAIGSYEAYHFSESNEFCGTVCHGVMHPEWIAYQNSPHARVGCVDCHVGSGADWYVRSKLSGLYQVYSVTFDKYQKPIPTPVQHLRPAQETCEQCHWPNKFYAYKLRSSKHYLADSANSEWNIEMVMKIGSSHSALGLEEGIHWHINPDVKIEYVYLDEQRQIIPWVRRTNNKTGEINYYVDGDYDISENPPDSLEIRTMDCMDCHNRPSHNYRPPAFFVNNAFVSGIMPKELPELKKISMEICSTEFSTKDSAMTHIESNMKEFYKSTYPEIYEKNYQLIASAIKGLKIVYNDNIFPEMKVRWDKYPNNIGHVEFNGCFRCHNDNHISPVNNKVISKDCEQCHIIKAQGFKDSIDFAAFNNSLEFKHPVDIGEGWRFMNCTDCHTGLSP